MTKAGRESGRKVGEVVGLAALSVVSGSVFAVWSHFVAPVAFGVAGHLGVGAIYGMWFIGATLPAYVLRRCSRWGYGTMALAGALPVIAAYPFDCLVSPFYPTCRFYPPELHLAIVAAMLLSGAILGGVLVKAVVDALVSAGRLRGWPVAQAESVQSEAR
jgi:energy-coupling factor transport system substrate-specific component